MAESFAWAIADAIPDNGVIMEWGSGGSTIYWINESRAAEVLSIEHDRDWYGRVHRAKKNPDVRFEFACTNDVVEYTRGSWLPVDTADVILIDGIERKLSTAYAATVAKEGCRLFLHDSEDPRYDWILKFMEDHPDWAFVREHTPLPEDKMQRERGMEWVRL